MKLTSIQTGEEGGKTAVKRGIKLLQKQHTIPLTTCMLWEEEKRKIMKFFSCVFLQIWYHNICVNTTYGI